MSILTKNMQEINDERQLNREFLAKDRPTSQSKKRKWLEIERLIDDLEEKRLLSDEIQIG